MNRSFADMFSEAEVASIDGEMGTSRPVYDETRELNIIGDGTIFVEAATIGLTQTDSKARGESDDFDESTITEVQAEVDRWSVEEETQSSVLLSQLSTKSGTETQTFVDSEGDDQMPTTTLGTRTGVDRESDDSPSM